MVKVKSYREEVAYKRALHKTIDEEKMNEILEKRKIFDEVRDSWLYDLGYTLDHIMYDKDWKPWVLVDGYRIYLPEELTSLEAFYRRVRSKEYEH